MLSMNTLPSSESTLPQRDLFSGDSRISLLRLPEAQETTAPSLPQDLNTQLRKAGKFVQEWTSETRKTDLANAVSDRKITPDQRTDIANKTSQLQVLNNIAQNTATSTVDRMKALGEFNTIYKNMHEITKSIDFRIMDPNSAIQPIAP
jgi:hypothetical protein